VRRYTTTLIWGAACAALLLVNVAAGLEGPLGKVAPVGYRYWEDFTVALRAYRGARAAQHDPSAASDFHAAQAEIARLGIRPWQFWRTVDTGAFVSTPDAAIRPYEDLGRARLLAWTFRVLGGISPFALFWLAPLLVVPVLVWTAWETAAAGHGIAGGTFVLLVALSAFVADALPLAYSPVGFYVAAALLVVPWSTYLLGPAVTLRGLAVRTAGLAALLALCTQCRGGVLLLLPGFLLPLLALLRRPLPRRGQAAAAVAILLTVPPIVARSFGGHDFWIGAWEGLGDFDREKGHVWSDADAKRFARGRGYDLRDPGAQAAFRDEVLGSIAADPAWYAGILVRRLGVTLSQWTLWPAGTIRPDTHPNQGVQAAYYSLTRTVDVFALGRGAVEVPVPALLAGPVVLLALAASRPRDAGREVGVVGSLLLGLLGLPVLVSTAGALETQAAALAWLLAWGFVVERGVRTWRARRSPAPAATSA
jgi:hypothetical protein